ncbi:MAG: hypothetical protein K2X00_20275 [Nitrospiraceae bacterium]|nr:hypothetical protein [Nitrospiraceae bacterium]
MTRRDLVAMLGAGMGALSLPGCSIPKSSRYRQKITVEVDTPSGVKSGSSVIEVGYAEKPEWAQSFGGNGFSARGEAVAVDVAPGKTLFALLMSPNDYDFPWYQSRMIIDALHLGAVAKPPIKISEDDYSIETHQLIGRLHVKLDLPKTLYPLIVTFTDLREPKTVEAIKPDKFSEKLGSGVNLKRITVEVTDEPITTGIEKRLPWLMHSGGGMLDGSRINDSNRLSNQLSAWPFSTEIRR